MSTRQVINTTDAPTPAGAYSQGTIVNGFLYTSGMGPIDPQSGKVVGETIEAQTRQVMENLRAILTTANLDFTHVIKATVHLQELLRDFHAFDTVYREYLTENPPVRTTVGSDLYNILVEIDIVANVPVSFD